MPPVATAEPKANSTAAPVHTVTDIKVCIDGRKATVKDVPAVRSSRFEGALVAGDLLDVIEDRLRVRGFRAGAVIRYATLVR